MKNLIIIMACVLVLYLLFTRRWELFTRAMFG